MYTRLRRNTGFQSRGVYPRHEAMNRLSSSSAPTEGSTRNTTVRSSLPVNTGPSRSGLSREDLTPRQEEALVGREGISVGHPGHEIYGLGCGIDVASRPLL